MTLTRRKFLKTGSLLTAGLSVSATPLANAASLVQQEVTATPTFLCLPYLQYLTPTEVTIMWITNHGNCHGWVEYGENGALDQRAEEVHYGLIPVQTKVNKVRITGLKPNTSYSYKVCSREITEQKAYSVKFGGTLTSFTYKFTTPFAEDTSMSALIFNDVHENTAIFSRMIGLSKLPNYDFVFLNGDMVNYITNENKIVQSILTPLVAEFASTKPFFTVRGNHETRDVYARKYFDYFQLGDTNAGYYTFSWGPVFFIVLDSGEDKADNSTEYYGLVNFDPLREKQAVWLEQVMQSSAYQNAKYRVVFMHIPTFESGDWHGTTHCKTLFNPLFNQYSIDVLISGHTHKSGIYLANSEHNYPIVIGGGTGTSSSASRNNASVIKLQADLSTMKIEIVDYSGATMGIHNIPARASSSLQAVGKEAPSKVYVSNSSVCIDADTESVAEILLSNGQVLQTQSLHKGLNYIQNLEKGNLYVIRFKNTSYKIFY